MNKNAFIKPLLSQYAKDQLSAREAQEFATFIAWGPAVFQVSRLMIKFGVFDLLRESSDGLTRQEITEKCNLSDYAMGCLLEASLSIGTILVNPDTERYSLSKIGWFLLTDPIINVNINFNHDVNYKGWFHLEESLLNGKPEGLKEFGNWSTLYEALLTLPSNIQKSWFAFDHFYSDSSFSEALDIVFNQHNVKTLYDVGGNTGNWALRCVGYDKDVEVMVFDLPQQIEMMKQNVAGKEGAERIFGYGINLLDEQAKFPRRDNGLDAIWMSQMLASFRKSEIISILKRTKEVMTNNSRLYIMETLWDRQRFKPAAFCLTMLSLYFAAIVNGNSKIYNTEGLESCICEAGLEIERIYDHLGKAHSIFVCKKI